MAKLEYAGLKVGGWSLSELVRDPKSEEFSSYLRSIEDKVGRFESARQNLQNGISSSEFLALLKQAEDIIESVSIASGYAHLRYYADTSSNEASALVTQMEQVATGIGNRMLFFDLWFKKELDDQNAARLIESSPLVYREYLSHKRKVARYSLSEPEEKVINIMSVTGIGALVKIYDRLTSGFEFTMRLKKGRKLVIRKFDSREKLVTLVRSPDANERAAAYQALFEVYKKNSGILGDIYRNVVIQWRDEAVKLRSYASPISARNISNDLDDETVHSLLAACSKNAGVFQDYFKEKAKMLGLKKLRRYDLYAPLNTKTGAKKFTYGKAVQSVLETFESFEPRFRSMAERLFDEKHVDSAIRKGKRGGAFCHTVTPKITPYVLLNFDGRTRDVSTLAHEFGHAIHSMAAEDKPVLVAHAPLPLAETASVFAEMLLNEKLAEDLSRKEQRLLLAEQIDDMYATIMRQAYFTLFEVEAHKEIGEHGATTDEVADHYEKNLRGQFGGSVAISPEFRWEWTYIPHFYHTPFYCYAYSFGNLLVLSLYKQYKEEGKSSFVPKYFEILAAGGSRKPEELLLESGIDITKEQFWQQGFDFVREMIKQLKDLGS